MKKIFEVPHYVKDRTKYGEANSRVADYIWWLFNHRNEVVSVTGTLKRKGSLNALVMIKDFWKTGIVDDLVYETPEELAAGVNKNIEKFRKRNKGWTLATVSVNGGNGEDRPNIPVYHVNF